jgi:osmoprotectant transport system substrate-binding protein
LLRVSRSRVVLAIAWMLAALLAACGQRSTGPAPQILTDDAITIGAFDFPESELLARLYGMALEHAGFRVDLQLSLGPRELVEPALERGLIELLPEYAGSALGFFGDEVPTSGPRATHDALTAAARDRGLVALAAAPAQDQNGFVVTAETARLYGLQKVSDLAPYATHLTFGGPTECPSRPLCLEGLRSVYGLSFAGFVPLDAGGSLTVAALHSGQIDIGLLFTTDGAIDAEGFVPLRDDRHLQPAENVTPIVRPEVLTALGPRLADVVNAVSAALTTADLRAMNAEVNGGASPAAVARAWIASHDLRTG